MSSDPVHTFGERAAVAALRVAAWDVHAAYLQFLDTDDLDVLRDAITALNVAEGELNEIAPLAPCLHRPTCEDHEAMTGCKECSHGGL